MGNIPLPKEYVQPCSLFNTVSDTVNGFFLNEEQLGKLFSPILRTQKLFLEEIRATTVIRPYQ